MSLCFKSLKFTKSNDIKIKREMDVNINLYSHCIDCGFEHFEAIHKEDLSGLLKILNYMKNNVVFFKVQKSQKVKGL